MASSLRRPATILLASCLAALPAHSQYPAAAAGMQRAASSTLAWEIREAGHPSLGEIQFAFLKTPVETPAGKAKVYSRAYLSCQKGMRKFAIELTNATTPDDPKGLRPSVEPRLYCNRPLQPWDPKLVQEELLAKWEINELGDALARGFRAFPLRECVSISVVQEVALPQGWGPRSAKVEFEMLPYARELDAIFVACGEVSAYGLAAAAPPVVRTPAAAPAPAPATAKPAIASVPAAPPKAAPVPAPATAPAAGQEPAPAQPASAPWRPARVIAGGKTNVRAGPRLESPVVVQLNPGAPVLVQKTDGEWWRARQASGAPFDGYIRQDRLTFR